MNKKILTILLATSSVLSVYGQHALNGRVIDKDKNGISYANIRVIASDSIFVAGTSSDSLGIFSINIKPGRYTLVTSCLGYETDTASIDMSQSDLQMPAIILQNDAVMLGDVTVQASSFVRQKDRVLVIPDKKQIKHAHTGYDLLSKLMIPGIDVNTKEGKVKTFGGDVTLYIDGRKVDYREVQSLRPKDVERIEYHDVPTGKYANDIAAINYVTRQYRAGGYIALDGTQTIGYLGGNYNAVAKLAHGNTSYTLFGGHKMEKFNGTKTNGEEFFHLSEQDFKRLTSTLDGNQELNGQYVQMNVENRNEKRTLVGKLSFVRNDEPDNYNLNRLEYQGIGSHIKDSKKWTEQRGLMPSLNLYGYFNLKNDQFIEATVTGTYTNNKYSYSYEENDYNTFTRTDEDLYTVFGNINYGIKFKHQNSLTGQLYHLHNISLSDYSGSNDTWQHLWTGETILFAEYSHQLGKNFTLKAAPGFSCLQYKLHGEKRIKQFSPRLRARLIYRIANNQQIQLTGNVGNTFPNISTMNNTTQFVDSWMEKRGNSSLIPAKLYATALIYGLQTGRFNLQSMLNYLRGKDVTTQFFFEENQKLVQSYTCGNNANVWNANLSLSYKVTDDLRFKLDGSWMNLKCQGDLQETFNALSAKVQVDYYLKDFSFSLYGKSKEKQMDMDLVKLTMPIHYGLSISYSHNNLYAEIGTENPFTKTSKQISETQVQDIYQIRNTLTCRTYQQTGYIKLAYTFNFGKKTSRSYNDVKKNISSAILKAK